MMDEARPETPTHRSSSGSGVGVGVRLTQRPTTLRGTKPDGLHLFGGVQLDKDESERRGLLEFAGWVVGSPGFHVHPRALAGVFSQDDKNFQANFSQHSSLGSGHFPRSCRIEPDETLAAGSFVTNRFLGSPGSVSSLDVCKDDEATASAPADSRGGVTGISHRSCPLGSCE